MDPIIEVMEMGNKVIRAIIVDIGKQIKKGKKIRVAKHEVLTRELTAELLHIIYISTLDKYVIFRITIIIFNRTISKTIFL